jgi:hypothetical protein
MMAKSLEDARSKQWYDMVRVDGVEVEERIEEDII